MSSDRRPLVVQPCWPKSRHELWRAAAGCGDTAAWPGRVLRISAAAEQPEVGLGDEVDLSGRADVRWAA